MNLMEFRVITGCFKKHTLSSSNLHIVRFSSNFHSKLGGMVLSARIVALISALFAYILNLYVVSVLRI